MLKEEGIYRETEDQIDSILLEDRDKESSIQEEMPIEPI